MAAPIPHEAIARAVRAAFGERAAVRAEQALCGDASSRRYVRLELADATVRTAVVMLLGKDRSPLGSDEIGGTKATDELPFVNVARYLAARGFAVPAIYHDASAADALLLLEDVGDTTLWAAIGAEPARTRALFEEAIDLLVALQVAGARHPDPSCRGFRQRFDGRLARWELEHFVEHGIETRHAKRLPADERALLLAGLAPVAAPFERDAPVLAHRDYMAWNIHVQGGRLRPIDFQDALLAPDAYDLASLLTDRTTGTVVTPALEASLVDFFCAARDRAGFALPGGTDAFRARYRCCALQRALKVIGRFHYLETVLGKPGYLAYLPGVYAVARRMFDGLPDLAPVRARVATFVPELAAS
jgi:aminoglycoside/choline kinase family phosphotransferase